jgi:threonine/homoserine/homoserine lactone efflux protein
MEMSVVMGFWIVSFLLIMTPGADWAYTITAGISGRGIIPAVMGLMSGHLLATAVVVAGMGVLLAGHPLALSALTFFGALYLFWLGIGMLRRPAVITAGSTQAGGTWNRWAIKGMCISGMNPKVFLLFLALLPQFTDPQSHWPLPLQMSALALLHLITCTLVYLLVGYGSRALLATRPQAAKVVSMISGGMMIVISLLLLAEQIIHH